MGAFARPPRFATRSGQVKRYSDAAGGLGKVYRGAP